MDSYDSPDDLLNKESSETIDLVDDDDVDANDVLDPVSSEDEDILDYDEKATAITESSPSTTLSQINDDILAGSLLQLSVDPPLLIIVTSGILLVAIFLILVTVLIIRRRQIKVKCVKKNLQLLI